MKEQWKNLYKQINGHVDLMAEYAKEVAPNVGRKNLKLLINGINNISRLAFEFDHLVEPVTPKPIDMPYKSEAFAEVWSDYKAYLTEDHQIYFHSREEFYRLKRLKKWAGNSEALAVDILEWLMSTHQRSFFKPSQKQLSGDEPAPTEQKTTPGADLGTDRGKRV